MYPDSVISETPISFEANLSDIGVSAAMYALPEESFGADSYGVNHVWATSEGKPLSASMLVRIDS